MAAKPSLRAVDSEDRAPGQNVASAAASGDHRTLLMAMRDRIAHAISDPGCPPRDLAALTRRLQDIAKELDAHDLRAADELTKGANVSVVWDEASI
jgi:hypothetical protein